MNPKKDEFLPNQTVKHGPWTVSLTWTYQADPLKKGDLIGRGNVTLKYKEQVMKHDHGITAFKAACEAAEHFEKVGHVPKEMVRVRADYPDYKTRNFTEIEERRRLKLEAQECDDN